MKKREVQSCAQLAAPAESVKNKHSRFVPVKILIIVCWIFTLIFKIDYQQGLNYTLEF